MTALGVIAGLYLRGLAFEYRATWESTFLGAEQVHALLAATLAPGSWLTGIPVPDAASIAAIQQPASENAATWMHLLAGTVVTLVILPRLALAAVAWMSERRRAARVALPLSEPYYQRLVASYLGGPGRVRVVPYSYTVRAQERAGLDAILARAYPGAAATVEGPVAWGDDRALAMLSGSGGAREDVVPLFALSATPEREAHGAFLDAIAAHHTTGSPLMAMIDESGVRLRWHDDQQRIEGRRAGWRDLLGEHGVTAVFIDLSAPDLARADAALTATSVGAGADHQRRTP
jgi:hypothetical protein